MRRKTGSVRGRGQRPQSPAERRPRTLSPRQPAGPAQSRARIQCFQALAPDFPGERQPVPSPSPGLTRGSRGEGQDEEPGGKPQRPIARAPDIPSPLLPGLLTRGSRGEGGSRARIQCFQGVAGSFPGARRPPGSILRLAVEAPPRKPTRPRTPRLLLRACRGATPRGARHSAAKAPP